MFRRCTNFRHLTERYGVKSQKWSDLSIGNSGFHRFKARVKPEIVSFGVDDLDMQQTGKHVDARTWDALIDDPEVIVIDTRNDYEIDIGTFEGAISPHTENFRQFPAWVADNLDAQKHTKVAMFCTGGIRCEKASSYLLNQGFMNVYHLDGGILQYLEDTQAEDSRWNGECFVFDQRVSVNAQLQQGQYKQCYACRHPLSAVECASTDFEHGVSCPYCIGRTSQRRRQQFRERQNQIKLAHERGEQHIGLRQKRKSATAEEISWCFLFLSHEVHDKGQKPHQHRLSLGSRVNAVVLHHLGVNGQLVKQERH